jgi:aminoglycoside 2'-N-acetyltransferase I
VAGVSVRLAHTAELDAATRAAVRALLEHAFDGDFAETDWDHALGGLHALALEDEVLVGHAAVVQRQLLVGDRPLRSGYVEAVAVRADRRRRGHGGALMAAIEGVIRGAYDLGALGATDDGARIYAARGWQRWVGPTAVLSPAGRVPTPDEDGAIWVLETGVPLDRTAPLACDWRAGDVW